MKTGAALALTIAVVAFGRWSRGDKLDMKVTLALAFIGLALAVMQEGNAKFAQQMAALILVGAVVMNGKDIFTGFNTGQTVGKMRQKVTTV